MIYYWATVEEAIFMLFTYSKGEQGDLTPSQVKVLGRLVREEFR